MSLYKDASLVMIPSAYKDGKLYSIRPTDGSGDFTFSRGSNLAATRVDVNGLIEKGRENRLLHSNDFTLGNWGNDAGTCTRTGGQSGYDGTNDAWLITQDTAGYDNIRSLSTGLTSGVSTMSVYAKAGTSNNMHIRVPSDASRVQFNLSTGVATNKGGAIYQGMDDVGGGWYRCYATFNSNVDLVQIYPEFGSSTPVSIYIQDAQLEAGLVATDYIETGASTAQAGILEDMPRLDYSGGASCPALLLEPQRSNITAYSEYFDGWTQTNGSVTANDIVSPEGVVNGYKLTSTSNGTASRVEIFPSLTDNTIYTGSAFVKKGNVNFAFLTIRPKTAVTESAFFDLENGTITSQGNSPDGATIEDYGNGWYRISLSTNAETGGTTPRFQIAVANTDGSVVTNADEYIYIYGAQLELGSYPTSYIPTYGSSVTRSDDFMNISSLADEIDGNSFTYFLEVNNEAVVRDASTGNISVGASGNRFFLYNDSTTSKRLVLFIQDSSGTQSYTLSADNVKLVIRLESNKVEVFENGVSVLSTTQNLDFSANSAYVLRGTTREIGIKQTAIFPTALTDSECIALTTL